jgi:Protein of unknown function (DUF4235)
MAGRGGNLSAQAVLVLGGLAAAAVAKKVVNIVWVAATGREVPKDPGDPAVSTREAVAFAVASAATIGTAKVLVARKASALKGDAGKDAAVKSGRAKSGRVKSGRDA